MMKLHFSSQFRIRVIMLISAGLILFIPLLYSAVYLGSVWDTYGHIDQVPVAFVNLDQPCVKDGKTYAIGQDLVDNLKENDKVAWRFVSPVEAKSGVEGTAYYAMIEIPADFSQKIAKVQDGLFTKPEILYTANKGKNFVFGQISDKVAESIRVEVDSSIQKEIAKAMVESLDDVQVSLKDASSGADTLADGEQKLLDGSAKLADGTKEAAEGSGCLSSGLSDAVNGTKDLQDGLGQMLTGSEDLADGLHQAASGSKKLAKGLSDAADGEKLIVGGSKSLVDGLTTFKTSLTTSDASVAQLVQGAASLSDNIDKLAQGGAQLDTGLQANLNQAAAAIENAGQATSSVSSALTSELDMIQASDLSDTDKAKLAASIQTLAAICAANDKANLPASLRAAGLSAAPLASGLKSLSAGGQAVSGGVAQLATALAQSKTQASAALDQLIAGASQINSGSDTLLQGLNVATQKTWDLTDGLKTLYDGEITLKDGLQQSSDGTASLKDGLTTAYEKTCDLNQGLVSLQTGSNDLKKGLGEATDGADELKKGLADGYQTMNSKLNYTADDMASFVSSPVELVSSPMNNVDYYGAGFAPYFVSLSLWLGAMFVSLLLQIISSKLLGQNRIRQGFGAKWLVGSVLVAVQAILVSVALTRLMGLQPVSLIGFYGSAIFISVIFFGLMFGVSNLIGVFGAPVMFVIFVLQLASSGGTFPIETAPFFYRLINPYMPMTYAVKLLRQVISGIDWALLSRDLALLMAFMLPALLLGWASNRFWRRDKTDGSPRGGSPRGGSSDHGKSRSSLPTGRRLRLGPVAFSLPGKGR